MEVVLRNWQALLAGAQTTVLLAVVSVSLATVMGAAVGIVSAVGWYYPRLAVVAVGFFVRGVPPLILIFLFYYGLPAVGIFVPTVAAAVAALSIYGAAFIAEVVRGAINAVPRHQAEAGYALGMTTSVLMRRVVLPQAVRYSLPPYANMLARLIRLTTIASIVNIHELTLASREIVQRDLQPFAVLGIAMIFYFLMSYPLTRLSVRLERRFTYAH